MENETDLTEEFDMASTETDQDEAMVSKWTGEAVEGPVVTIAVEAEESEEILTFELVETVPVFPGCKGAFNNNAHKACFQQKIMAHVAENFKFPAAALQMNLQGRIFVQFLIERDGSVSNVTVLRGVDPLLDKEAIRVIKSLPRIEPAKQRGKPVRMSFVMPINAIVRNNG